VYQVIVDRRALEILKDLSNSGTMDLGQPDQRLRGCLSWPRRSTAFPDNGVLDTFTGTDDTSPPNANWANAELSGGSGCAPGSATPGRVDRINSGLSQ
jgi:hypothetical protein